MGVEVGRPKTFLPEVETINLRGWSERLGWALMVSWVTATLPRRAQDLSAEVRPCHLCQHSLVFCLEAIWASLWAEPRLHTCLWAFCESVSVL